MIGMYCRRFHGVRTGLCESCTELETYAHKRTEDCIFGVEMPPCSKCPSHCYKNSMREMIRAVMRYAGPRIMYYYPWLAFMHTIDKIIFRLVKH